MIDQTWTITNNGIKTERQRMGMMVARVDSDGNILWTAAKRLNTNTAYDRSGYIDHQWLPTPSGIMLAWVDHIANATGKPGKPVKLFVPFKHTGILNVWTLTADGKEDQSFIELKRQAMAGHAHILDNPGEYILLLTNGRKNQLTKLTLEK